LGEEAGAAREGWKGGDDSDAGKEDCQEGEDRQQEQGEEPQEEVAAAPTTHSLELKRRDGGNSKAAAVPAHLCPEADSVPGPRLTGG